MLSLNNSIRVPLRAHLLCRTGLDVDVAPVLYEGDPDDKGYLIVKDTGQRVLTSIPSAPCLHQNPKKKHPQHFRQVIRLLKWWVRRCRNNDDNFDLSPSGRANCAHLSDQGSDFSDYQASLERALAFIVKSELKIGLRSPTTTPRATCRPQPVRLSRFRPGEPAQQRCCHLYRSGPAAHCGGCRHRGQCYRRGEIR